jgi:hypothetical protein
MTETRKFQVDDILVMHSSYTDDDVLVVYRGPLSGNAVIYRVKTGWQGAVPYDWLHLATDEEKTKYQGV